MPEKKPIRSPGFWKIKNWTNFTVVQQFPNTEFIVFTKKFKNNREKGEQSSNTLKLWINSKQMNMNKRIPWGLLHMFPKLGLLPLLSDGSGELCWSCFFPVKTHLPSKSHMFDRKSSSLAIPTPGGRSARYVSSNRDTKRDSPRTSTWKDLLDTQEPVSTTPASWT